MAMTETLITNAYYVQLIKCGIDLLNHAFQVACLELSPIRKIMDTAINVLLLALNVQLQALTAQPAVEVLDYIIINALTLVKLELIYLIMFAFNVP